ncbi:hypothetical protein [Mixta theicola]|nr:hypothetical protein [Mixta theicola]
MRARRLLTERGWLDDHQLRIEEGVIAAMRSGIVRNPGLRR